MTESSLRKQQKTLTRDLIMEALVGLISDEGMGDFSVQSVADRAGVSHRTVYRHYPSREALLNALAEWLDERMLERGGVMQIDDESEFPEAIRRNFRLFEEMREMVDAYVVLCTATGARVEARTRRTREIQRLIRRTVAGHLSSKHAKAASSLIRLISGSTAWHQMRTEYSIDAASTSDAIAWAAGVLIRELADGGGPSTDN